jgi:maleamate amidohydrolase
MIGKHTMPNALDEDYARAGFGGRLAPGLQPALLVVDVNEAYLDPESPLYAGVESALEANIRLVSAARAHGIPVIFTRVVFHESGMDGGLFFQKVPALKLFISGEPLAAFSPKLQPMSSDLIVEKHYPSAFFGTSLASTLHAAHIDTLMITGFSTSGCVRATALDALQYGFVPLVVREACGDRDDAPHQANLFDIQAKIGEVIDEATAIRLFQTD